MVLFLPRSEVSWMMGWMSMHLHGDQNVLVLPHSIWLLRVGMLKSWMNYWSVVPILMLEPKGPVAVSSHFL